MCEIPRAAPGEYTAVYERGLVIPHTLAVSFPRNRFNGECANERGSNAHNRKRAAHSKGECPSDLNNYEVFDENSTRGPMPAPSWRSNIESFPTNSAIDEWGRCLKHGYVPSRKRYKPTVVDASAALIQRKGDSFPSLIPGNSSQEEALRLELEFGPFGRLLANTLSPAEQACVKYNCQNPSRAKRHRHRTIKHLEALSDVLRPEKQRLSITLPVLAPARNLHIPLIQHPISDLNYTDKSLAKDLLMGMPIAGVIPRTSSLPANVTDATMKLHDVKGSVRTANTAILDSISKSTNLRIKQI